jgi:hypothetical protein
VQALTTIGNIPSSNWKRIKGHYVAVAAGVALATSVAITGFGTSGSQPGAPARQASLPAVTRNAEVPHQYFYVVSTEAERGALIHEGASNVVVAGSQEHFALSGEGAREMTATGVAFTVIDTTDALRAVAPAANRALDADIAASVLSTELANFPVATQRVASDSDIMASVISSELAAYGAPVAVATVNPYGSEADIMASVLSTELANFPVPAQRVASDSDILAGALSGELSLYAPEAVQAQPRNVAAADLAASVLSTELAHFGN